MKESGQSRDPTPIVVAIGFLLMSVLSFWIPDQTLGETARISGIISAIFCVIYWLANPHRGAS